MPEPARMPQRPLEPRGRFRFWKFRRRRVRYVAILPTLLTMANGVCGFLAIVESGRALAGAGMEHFHWAGYFILVAMVFDALDGKVARMTRTATNFGAQMDSLCDLVTFGIAPGFLVYTLNYSADPTKSRLQLVLLAVCAFYAMCTLLRLARFTVETSPEDEAHQDFSGLPSPAAAGVIASAVIPWNAFPDWPAMEALATAVTKALPFVAFVLGILMVSRIRYAHVVNRLFRGFRPFVRLIELAILGLLIIVFHEVAIFLAFAVYVFTGPFLWARARLFHKTTFAKVGEMKGTSPSSGDVEHDGSFF